MENIAFRQKKYKWKNTLLFEINVANFNLGN